MARAETQSLYRTFAIMRTRWGFMAFLFHLMPEYTEFVKQKFV